MLTTNQSKVNKHTQGIQKKKVRKDIIRSQAVKKKLVIFERVETIETIIVEKWHFEIK